MPTLRLCEALAGVGLGTVAVLVVQREAVIAKTQGVKRTADQILAGFARTSAPIPKSEAIVLVDDNVHSGNSLAAPDRLLGAGRPTFAFAVGVTDAQPCKDALMSRRFRVLYDETASVLEVSRVLDSTR